MAVNFNNGYNPYQNPYVMDPAFQQLTQTYATLPFTAPQRPPQPQPQSQPQTGKLNGRIIKSVNDISPGEIAMDGSVSLFPCEDGSAIYAKCWDSNGSISTTKYIPDGSVSNETTSFSMEDFQKETNDRLTRIEELVKSLCS